jgi:hypothetical protein
MAQVTDLIDRLDPGKINFGRHAIGTGNPDTDTRLADDELYPEGSSYVNRQNAELWVKLNNPNGVGVWIKQVSCPS